MLVFIIFISTVCITIVINTIIFIFIFPKDVILLMTSWSHCIRFFKHSRFFIFWHFFWLHIFTADTTCQMSSQTVWSCKLSFTLWILMLTHWNRFGKWKASPWLYPFILVVTHKPTVLSIFITKIWHFLLCLIICMYFFCCNTWERTAFSCFAVLFCKRKIHYFITSLLCYISSLHIYLL